MTGQFRRLNTKSLQAIKQWRDRGQQTVQVGWQNCLAIDTAPWVLAWYAERFEVGREFCQQFDSHAAIVRRPGFATGKHEARVGGLRPTARLRSGNLAPQARQLTDRVERCDTRWFQWCGHRIRMGIQTITNFSQFGSVLFHVSGDRLTQTQRFVEVSQHHTFARLVTV